MIDMDHMNIDLIHRAYNQVMDGKTPEMIHGKKFIEMLLIVQTADFFPKEQIAVQCLSARTAENMIDMVRQLALLMGFWAERVRHNALDIEETRYVFFAGGNGAACNGFDAFMQIE